MSREAHVRFCESAGVKLPRATHPYYGIERNAPIIIYQVDAQGACPSNGQDSENPIPRPRLHAFYCRASGPSGMDDIINQAGGSQFGGY